MATARAHIRIERRVDDVWATVSDPTSIAMWFPGVTTCTFADGTRRCTTESGLEVDERIVSNDDTLHRFQYSIVPGAVPVAHHIATVDVIADGDESLVVYGVDVEPNEFGASMQSTIDSAVQALKEFLEA